MTHRVSTSEDTPSGSSNSKLSSPQPLSRTAGAAGSVFVALSEDAQHLCYALFSGESACYLFGLCSHAVT